MARGMVGALRLDNLMDKVVSFSITDDDVNEARDAINQGGIETLRAHLLSKANGWKALKLNVGVTGNSGAGKTTFVNSIRGLKPTDEGAGKVGVKETTTKPTPYCHPNNPNLVFWDLPGVGTQKFPRSSYLSKIGIDSFDFFVIISDSRFTDNDLWLAQEIRDRGKHFLFARTKIGDDMENDKYDNPSGHDPGVVMSTMSQNLRENLGPLYDENRVFLIDSCGYGYQFTGMAERLLEDFPQLKRDALTLSITSFSENIIQDKINVMRKGVSRLALLAALSGLVPFPGTTIIASAAIVIEAQRDYMSQLGLDGRSLKAVAAAKEISIAALADELSLTLDIDESSIRRRVAASDQENASRLLSKAEKSLASVAFASWVMPLTGGLISYAVVKECLSQSLDEFAEAAVRVLAYCVLPGAQD